MAGNKTNAVNKARGMVQWAVYFIICLRRNDIKPLINQILELVRTQLPKTKNVGPLMSLILVANKASVPTLQSGHLPNICRVLWLYFKGAFPLDNYCFGCSRKLDCLLLIGILRHVGNASKIVWLVMINDCIAFQAHCNNIWRTWYVI